MDERKYYLWKRLMEYGDGSARCEGEGFERRRRGEDFVLIWNIWGKDEWSVNVKVEEEGRVSLNEKEFLLLLKNLGYEKYTVGS